MCKRHMTALLKSYTAQYQELRKMLSAMTQLMQQLGIQPAIQSQQQIPINIQQANNAGNARSLSPVTY